MSASQSGASRATARAAGVAIIASLLFLGCANAESADAPPAKTTFESSAWKADAPGVRHGMAENLINSRVLIGKSRDEVIALLGKPDQQGKDFLTYEVYSTVNTHQGPAYAIRVEFDAAAQRVHEVRVDTDTGIGDLDMN